MCRLPGLEPNADTWVSVAASARGASAAAPITAAHSPSTAVSAASTRAGIRRVRCSMVPPVERPCGETGSAEHRCSKTTSDVICITCARSGDPRDATRGKTTQRWATWRGTTQKSSFLWWSAISATSLGKPRLRPMTTHDIRSDTAAPPGAPAAAGTSVDVDLTRRTALVTGAASGIGRACAVRLSAAGATVRLADLDRAALDELAERGVGEPCPVDLTDLDAAEDVARGVDIVVNNAGVQTVSPVQDFPPERFSLILRLMLESPFRIVRAALPHMYAGGWGRIVNISSVHGLRASAYKSAYVAAKHGLEGFSKVVALEGAPH